LSGLHRQLGLLDATAIYVGIIVGSGIFFAPSNVAQATTNPYWGCAFWLIGGVIAASGALCYAECGARLPHDGGFFIFYRAVFGSVVAFVGGWVALFITYPASVAVMALIFARYLGEVVPALAHYPKIAASMAIFAAALLNIVGVRENAWSQRLLTGAKVTAIALLCAAAVIVGSPASMTPPLQQANTTASAIDLSLVVPALIGVLWTFSGWSDITLIAGELRDPARNLGRTVALGTAGLVALYVLVQLAVGRILPAQVAAESPRVVSDAVGTVLGPSTGRAVALLVVISTFGAINGVTLVVSRLAFAMAEHNFAPGYLRIIHRRLGTPVPAVATVAAVTLIYVFSSSFRDLLGFFTFTVWLFYGMTSIALLVLRRRKIGEPLAWRAPFGIVPPLVVLATGVMMTASLLADPQQRILALWGVLMLAIAVAVYLLIWRRRASE
jgi:APA family basic amino acid/polyamine antiporter